MNVFELLRDQVDLVELARRFTEMTCAGRLMRGRCPLSNHTDSNPSFFVYPDRRARCFGCGFHGDAVDLWAALKGFARGIDAALDLAREYGIRLPEGDPDSQRRTKERRDKEAEYEREAILYHKALSQHPEVVAYWDGRGFDEELRQRFLLGSNYDGSAATIPFWNHGRVQGLVRRQLENEPKYLLPPAEEFPGGYKPWFSIITGRGDVHVVEGPVDALGLAAIGFNAVAIMGNRISENQRREIRKFGRRLYLLPDADEEGQKAGRELARELHPYARLCPPEYGGGHKDAGDLFSANFEGAKELVEELKTRAVDALELELSDATTYSQREKWCHFREKILPLLIQIDDESERSAALQDVAHSTKLKASELRQVLKVALQQGRVTEKEEGTLAPKPGTPEHQRAMSILKEPDILERAAADMERLGHVGERRTKQLAFACALSARAGYPIQPSTHAQSSAGKNALWDTTLSLLPPEYVIRRSGLSAKALFRTEQDLRGAVLYIQELAGSESADYTIRVLQSDGRLEYEATEKTATGQMRNVVHHTEGPTVIVQTTTKNHLHPENETRVFPIYIDESEEQTRRITDAMLTAASGLSTPKEECDSIRRLWQDAIRLLEPKVVLVPYARRIDAPSELIRVRRDIGRVLDVIRVIAWLHQYQRSSDEQGRILATEDDFVKAVDLVQDSLTRAWKTLTPGEEKVMEAIGQLSEGLRREGFKRRDLDVHGLQDRAVKQALRSLTQTGYLDCDGRRGPQGFTYTVAMDLDSVKRSIFLRPEPGCEQPPADVEDTAGKAQLPDTARLPAQRASGGNRPNPSCPISCVSPRESQAEAHPGSFDVTAIVEGDMLEILYEADEFVA